MSELIDWIKRLERRIENADRGNPSQYKGTSAGDFTTATLPHHGDYGFQTTDNELQMNCNGTIRAVAMATL
ncbi:MAG: hypothetical protein GY832_03910 [Chloroflexi bacterium]|nr:hypothetical protein [Chloroflexota bacterium]